MHNKVLIVFPKYSPDDASHYSYWYPVFSQVGKKLDIKILFETPTKSVSIKNIFVLDTPDLPKPFNLLYRTYQIAKQMFSGYKKIYIHYSYSTFFIAKFLSVFSNAKIYYWNCEYYNSVKDSDKVLPIVLKLTDNLVTGSQMIGDRYKKIFDLKKPIKIVSNYVEPIRAKPVRLTKNNTHILFVHRLSPRKGSRELVSIILETTKLIPNAHFHIIGSGPDFVNLKSPQYHAARGGQISTLKLSKHVTFYGSLPHNQVVAFFKSCDVFIMPSRSEGFPRVILEAMLYQIPIVSTKVGNVSELVSNNQKKYLVDVGKPKLFAEAIKKLLLDPFLRKVISENYKKAKEYNKQRSVSEFINCFQ